MSTSAASMHIQAAVCNDALTKDPSTALAPLQVCQRLVPEPPWVPQTPLAATSRSTCDNVPLHSVLFWCWLYVQVCQRLVLESCRPQQPTTRCCCATRPAARPCCTKLWRISFER